MHWFQEDNNYSCTQKTVQQPSQGERIQERLSVSSSLGKWLQYKLTASLCRLAISKVRVEDISRDNITGAKNTLLLLNLGIILKKGLK